MTEAGYIRIVSNPAFSRDAVSPVQALAVLYENAKTSDHQFWADDMSAHDALAGFARRMVGHQQVTDAYLLALAIRHDGVLATSDSGISDLLEDKARQAESLEIL
jgi:predicted nucleic acid-binding protein